jgi:CheY-like chemotaxis protein
VLVIDDDEAVRLTFSHVLRLEGCGVQVAATAAEALGQDDHERPSAILRDLTMPFIKGVAFCIGCDRIQRIGTSPSP